MKMKSEDFIIRVRPFKDTDGSWSGDIDLSIITQPSNDLDLMKTTIRLCTSVK